VYVVRRADQPQSMTVDNPEPVDVAMPCGCTTTVLPPVLGGQFTTDGCPVLHEFDVDVDGTVTAH